MQIRVHQGIPLRIPPETGVYICSAANGHPPRAIKYPPAVDTMSGVEKSRCTNAAAHERERDTHKQARDERESAKNGRIGTWVASIFYRRHARGSTLSLPLMSLSALLSIWTRACCALSEALAAKINRIGLLSSKTKFHLLWFSDERLTRPEQLDKSLPFNTSWD